jgi:hypothetical protein
MFFSTGICAIHLFVVLSKHFVIDIVIHLGPIHVLQGLCCITLATQIIKNFLDLPWRRGLVVSSPPNTEETGALGREIESCQGIGW